MPEFHNLLLCSHTGHCWFLVVKHLSINQPPGPWNPCSKILAQGRPSSPSTAAAGRKRIVAMPLPALSTSGRQKFSLSDLPSVEALSSATFDFNLSRLPELFLRFEKSTIIYLSSINGI